MMLATLHTPTTTEQSQRETCSTMYSYYQAEKEKIKGSIQKLGRRQKPKKNKEKNKDICSINRKY